VTDSYPTPTWGDIDAFCKADEWDEVRETDHVHWEKALPSGEVLKTHRSLAAKKTIGPNVFGVILREQLKVSRDEFWRAINTGEPVARPVEPEEAPPQYPAYVVIGLQKYGYSLAQTHELTPEQAEALLVEKWSSPDG
jgi:hypothetical protein